MIPSTTKSILILGGLTITFGVVRRTTKFIVRLGWLTTTLGATTLGTDHLRITTCVVALCVTALREQITGR
ncbi:MAG: hypothetical protein MRK02_15550 [Candidatus Scalindua sp.]|nr:hypothetical protein [Candidatus Scalindua sp.]